MCFNDNTTMFRVINWAFAFIHLCFFIACMMTIVLRKPDNPLTLYYEVVITHGQMIEIYPIYVALFTHVMGLLFHVVFALSASVILDEHFSYNNTNPLRWVMQFFCDGSSLVGLMFIHGFHELDSIIMVVVLYASTLGYCYLQDQYLNAGDVFAPDREPHTFAIPIYLVMLFIIVAKSAEHINDEASIRISIVTLVSLFQTLVMFIIQRLHIKYKGNHAISDDGTGDKHEEEDEEEDDLGDIVDRGSKLDLILDEVRRGIRYETFYYLNSVFFQMTITWIIISITRSNQVLH
jgi:hypothetical protein